MAAWRCATVAVGAGALLAASPQEQPPLAELLRRAGVYLVDHTRQVTAVVAEERYEQIGSMSPPLTMRKRVLRSDVLVIANEEVGWVGFRDVFEVDGSPVRDREERLARLMLKPDADTLRQARRIADESARYNVPFEGRDLRFALQEVLRRHQRHRQGTLSRPRLSRPPSTLAIASCRVDPRVWRAAHAHAHDSRRLDLHTSVV